MADDEERRLSDSGGTGGLGYAHAMPSFPASVRQPKDRESAISQRWESRWCAWVAMASKLEEDPAAAFSRMKITHHSRCAAALNAGLAWTTILRSEIDSPLEGEVWFNAMLRLSVERRRARMGRQKGRIRKPHRIRERERKVESE